MTKTLRTTDEATSHKWEFKARFRRHAFGWKSQPAIAAMGKKGDETGTEAL
jgi:hypothetical protein